MQNKTTESGIPLACLKRVPAEIAVCPECGGELWWQLTCDDPDLAGLELDCDWDESHEDHRWWQSDWQPVLDEVKKYMRRTMLPNGQELSHAACDIRQPKTRSEN